MPRLRAVISLRDLSHQAVCEIVSSALKNMQISYPCNMGLHYDIPDCSAAVQQLQCFLRDLLPVSLWQPMLKTILETSPEKTWLRDQRLLYGIFTYDNVDLKTLKITTNGKLRDVFDDATEIVRSQHFEEFWLQRVNMLKRLLVVDLSSIRSADIVLAVSATCSAMHTLVLPACKDLLSLENLEAVFRSCKNLRSLTSKPTFLEDPDPMMMKLALELLKNLEFVHMETIADQIPFIDTNCRLKLRALAIDSAPLTVDHIETVIDLCPHLNRLIIARDDSPADLGKIFQYLASSVLKLSEINLYYFHQHSEVYDAFLSCKGVYITALNIARGNMSDPLNILQAVSKYCPNVTRLNIDPDWQPAEHVADKKVTPRISFPKLTSLGVSIKYKYLQGLVPVINHCIEDAVYLRGISIGVWGKCGLPAEPVAEVLSQLITSNQRMRQLKSLTIACIVPNFPSEALARHVIATCSDLVYLFIYPLDATCLETLVTESRQKNMDISVNTLE